MKKLTKIFREFVSLLNQAKKNQVIESYMLIGGFAVSARAKPRATVDIDFLINAKRGTYEKKLSKTIREKGYNTVISTGDLLDPLRIYKK